jgi:hypothetical protein
MIEGETVLDQIVIAFASAVDSQIEGSPLIIKPFLYRFRTLLTFS